MKIIFIGTPDFGAIILEKLIQNNLTPCLVITESDKPAGREKVVVPPPVKVVAEKYNIAVSQPEKIINCKLEIEKLNPDLMVVAAYGQIISKEILNIPKYGCLNIHPSLLPKYRGSSPIQFAILSGDKETGVTIMLMDELVDHGSLVVSSKFLIASDDTYETLSKKLAEDGAELLIRTIPDWISGKIEAQPQNENEATFTKLLRKEDGKIDWNNPAEYIEQQIRAYYPWPGTYTFYEEDGKETKLKILKAKIQEQTDICPEGLDGKTFLGTNETIAVQTGNNFLIIEMLQPEGKKPMTSCDFLLGHPDFVGIILK